MFYLQADVSVAVLQHGHNLAVRQAVHRLPVNTDDPVSHLKTQRDTFPSLPGDGLISPASSYP